MYLIIKVSKRRVKYHDKCYGDKMTYIPKGVPYVCIDNGTIGQGSRHRNYPLEVIQQYIIRARTKYIAENNNPIEENITENKVKGFDYANDIPF